MPIIYITGVEGSGKSTVCDVLASRGFMALDIDKEGLSARFVKMTGERLTGQPSDKERTAEWYNDREWRLPVEDVVRLKYQAGQNTIFLAGITENFDEIKDLFTKVICLTLDEDTTIYRVAHRLKNDFGKTPVELARILDNREVYEQKNRDSGSIMVDASRQLPEVVDNILSNVSKELQII